MGQKVHPTAFRLGINKKWTSTWFADGDEYSVYLHEDLGIRKLIKKRCQNADISRILIDRPTGKKVNVTIFSAKPGIIIGKKGVEVEKLRRKLKSHTGREMYIEIKEVKNPDIDAQLVAESVVQKLLRRFSYRRAMKQAVFRTMRAGAKGIKIHCAGRLGGAEIARKEHYHEGKVPMNTLRADIDYGFAEARTTYGIIGVKTWIYKGVKFGLEDPAEV